MTDITTKKSATNTKGNDFNIAQVLGALLDHRWLIIGVVTLFAVFGIIYSLFTTPVYQADSLVQVEKKPGGSLLDNLSQMIPNSQAESTTEIELIKSRMIIGKAVDDLGLDVSVERKFFPVFGKGWARLTGSKPQEIEVPRLLVPEILFGEELTLTVLDDQSFSLSDDDGEILKGKFGDLAFGQGVTVVVNNISAKAGATYYITKKTRLAAINSVLKSLVVTDRGKKTGVLELTLTGESKALVQKTLNSIDENYVLQNVARKSEEAEKSLEFLKEQLPAVRSSLDDAEDKLNSYRKKNDSVDLSLEAKSVLDSIVAVESQLNELTFKEAEISKLFTKEHRLC
ncbi:hypothetical protein AS658_08030 [Serratia marcescens]|uniref:Wzz/FepE/Etk N-terminal domain-containing protein n=1 Tax=Serratia marcescens TaxID=615 RepID=UPI0006591D3F|nr:Wzz/FepE/Etk N-terminal domain-containing protein [Serratia marcescens]AVU34621.1 hypothetical protein AM681_08170 [Serratia marcescens]AVU39725.1 hypothetical protein AS658_08030 [Serratia marcescens]KLX18892.1 hypothetical protein SK68_02065 [Serratia marcescens]KMJ13126.1 hypothetical protein SN03_01937 [Serratia marcescens]